MKNILAMALVAGLLFAVSAGLSLFLNQPKETEETGAVADEKKPAKKNSQANDKHTPKVVVQPNPTGDVAESTNLAAQLQTDIARVAQREEELESQREIVRVVLEDLRGEMDALQKALPKVGADTKPGFPKPGESLAPPPIKPTGATEPKVDSAAADAARNLRTVTGISESMPADKAARIIEQMAKSGKADTAVQLLAKMNPRQSAKILASITDDKLSVQLFEKLLEMRHSQPSGSAQ